MRVDVIDNDGDRRGGGTQGLGRSAELDHDIHRIPLLASGEGALDRDDHVPVSDGLVPDDGHEWREHEHDEADGHRRAHGGEDNRKRKHGSRSREQGDVERVDGAN